MFGPLSPSERREARALYWSGPMLPYQAWVFVGLGLLFAGVVGLNLLVAAAPLHTGVPPDFDPLFALVLVGGGVAFSGVLLRGRAFRREFVVKCAGCGTPNVKVARFCRSCGRPIQPRALPRSFPDTRLADRR